MSGIEEEDDEGPAAGWRRRRNGFTAKKRGIYLEALAKYGTIADACRVAGISTTTAARHEKRDPEFRSLCRAARARVSAGLETLAWERGVTGIDEEIVHHGKVVGTRRKRSDSIFRMILIAGDPERYGRQGASARSAIEKEVERRLRGEIEAEVRAGIAAEQAAVRPDGDVFDELVARLKQVREQGVPPGWPDGGDT